MISLLSAIAKLIDSTIGSEGQQGSGRTEIRSTLRLILKEMLHPHECIF